MIVLFVMICGVIVGLLLSVAYPQIPVKIKAKISDMIK